MFAVEVVFVARAGAFLGCEFKFSAALAGVKGSTTVAGGEVVGVLVGVVEALLFVVGWRKAGDKLTGAIGVNLVVIVTMRSNISMSRSETI